MAANPSFLFPQAADGLAEAFLPGVVQVERCRGKRRTGHHPGPVPDQALQLFHGLRQHPFIFRNPEDAVTLPFRRAKLPVHHLQAAEEHVRIAVVIFETLREGGQLVGFVAHFVAQVPEHVHHRLAAFLHIADTGQVTGEPGHVRPPGLPAQEGRADTVPETGSRRQEAHLGVVGIGMEDVVGYALGHVQVGHLLEHLPVLVPVQVKTGEALGRHPLFPVNMGGRCRGLDGLEVEAAHKIVLDGVPELAHGHVCVLVVLQGVHGHHIGRGGLKLHLHPRLVRQACHLPEEFLVVQLGAGAAPVQKEAGGGFRAVQHIAAQGRHPAAESVMVVLAETGLHVLRPVLVIALPAVHEHSVGQAGHRSVLQAPHIVFKLRACALPVQFVAFPAGGFLGGRPVFVADVHVTVAQDGPAARPGGECVPDQLSLRAGGCAQVHDVPGRNVGSAAAPGVALIHFLGAEGAAGGRAPVVVPGGRMEADVAEVYRMLVPEREFIFAGALRLVHGQIEGFDVLPAGHGKHGIGQQLLPSVRKKGLQGYLYAGLVAPAAAETLHAGQFQGADGGLFLRAEAQRISARFRPVMGRFGKGPDGQGLPRITLRRGKGQDADVPVVPPGLVGRLALGQGHPYRLSCGNVGAAPHQVPHGILRFNPRPSGHGPARTSLKGEAQLFAAGRAGHVLHHAVPLSGEGHHRVLHAGPSAAKSAVEPLDTADSRFADSLQIGLHTFRGHIVTDEVEPGFRPVFLGRIPEQGLLLREGGDGGSQGKQDGKSLSRKNEASHAYLYSTV